MSDTQVTLPENLIPADAPPEVKEALTNPEVVKVVAAYHRGLVSKKDELLSKLTARERQLEGLGNLDEIRAQLAEYQQLKAQQSQPPQPNQSVEDVRAEMKRLLDERDDKLKTLQEKRVASYRTEQLTRAIREQNGDPELLMPFVDRRVKAKLTETDDIVLEVRTADDKPLLADNGEPATLKELIAEFRRSQKYASLFAADNVGGTGSKSTKSATVDNPFLKTSPNYSVSEQTKLYRTNKPLAISLAAAAGIKLT